MSEWLKYPVTDFTQGYIDKVDATGLPAGALQDCRNMISRQIGKISSRGGQAKLNSTGLGSSNPVQGLFPFYLGTTKYLVIVVNGIAYSCTPPSGTMTQIKTGLDTTAPVQFVTAYVDGKNQLMAFNGVDTPWKWDGTGTAQVETATVVGTITTAGNATVIVTASGMTGTPVTLTVAVALNDTATLAAGKIRAAMALDAGIAAWFYIGGTGADIVLTRKTAAANDATVNISIANNTCAGITDDTTSADTTAGVAPGIADLNDYRTVSRETPTTSDYLTYTLAHKPVRTGSDKFFVFSNNSVLVYETGYTLDATNGTFTFSAARLNAVTDLSSDDAQTTPYPLNGRIELLHPFVISATYPVSIYDKDDNLLKTLTTETVTDDWKADAANGVVTAPLTLDYVNLIPFTAKYTWPDVIKTDYQYSNGTVSPQFRYPVTNKGRIFVMAGDDRIYWSEITENGSEYECWPPVNNWPVNQGMGETDGCLVPLTGDVYVFKNRSIHRFRGNELADYSLVEVVPNIGCVGPRAACQNSDNSMIYFVSEHGLYSFDGMTATNISRDRIPILWSTVNQIYLSQAVAFAWDGMILFALPVGSSATTNNMVFVYDISTGAFWPWDSMNLSCWAEMSTTSGTKLYAGSCVDGFILQQDVGDDDRGVNITSYFKPPTLDAGEADKMKKSRDIYIEHGEDQTTWADVYASKDYETALKLTATAADGALRKYATKPTIDEKWRYMDLTIQHDQAGPFVVRSVKLEYKLKDKSSVKGAVS